MSAHNLKYQRGYRRELRGKTCACGQPAVRNKSGQFLCAVCERAENVSQYQRLVQTQPVIRQEGTVRSSKLERSYERRSGDEPEGPICTHTLERLEQLFPASI